MWKLEVRWGDWKGFDEDGTGVRFLVMGATV